MLYTPIYLIFFVNLLKNQSRSNCNYHGWNIIHVVVRINNMDINGCNNPKKIGYQHYYNLCK